MRDINLPRHVMDCFERRWAARFADPGTRERVADDPFKSAQVHRLLEGALRPPSEASTVPDSTELLSVRASQTTTRPADPTTIGR
jgi:hypothetical protein